MLTLLLIKQGGKKKTLALQIKSIINRICGHLSDDIVSEWVPYFNKEEHILAQGVLSTLLYCYNNQKVNGIQKYSERTMKTLKLC